MYWIITFPKKPQTKRISKRTKDNVWTYLCAVVSPTSGSESPLGDNGSAGAGVSVGGSPHHPSCTSWSHMFCEGQGCIDKYTPCRGKCWSHTATRLCGDNMCLSEYQLEVTSLILYFCSWFGTKDAGELRWLFRLMQCWFLWYCN